PEIRPGDEVAVVNGEDRLLAVGKAVLSGVEMASFKSGAAVKVRRGSSGKG
ncbi:pseudouridine synthase, partial [Candidatus Bathyarchaeota archaeon]